MSFRIWLEDGPMGPPSPETFRGLLDKIRTGVAELAAAGADMSPAGRRWLLVARRDVDALLDEAARGPREKVSAGDWTPTYNYGEMMRLAGADLSVFAGRVAKETLPDLERAVATMEADLRPFIAMESDNGWGRAAELLRLYREMAAECRKHPGAVWAAHE